MPTDSAPFQSIRVIDLKEEDRPREKALSHGVKVLSDAELIALMLRDGLPGYSVLDMARDMLAGYDNSLVNLSRATISEISRKHRGVGPAKAVVVAAAFELARRWRDELGDRERHRRVCVTSSATAYAYIRSRVESLQYEEFWVLMLSRSNHIMAARCISQGGTAATVVDPKLLFRHCLDALASGIILVHNHPSGNLKPSVQDDQLTRRLCEGGKLLEIKVLDHLIVTESGYYSYNDEGRL